MSAGSGFSAFRLLWAADMDDNPTTFTSRASTFTSSVAAGDHATLLVKRTAAGIENYLVVHSDGERHAKNLGMAVGAKHVPCELPELGSEHVGHLVLTRRGASARETLAGVDPRELSRQLVTILDVPGSWVAVTFRGVSSVEKKRHQAWLSHRLNTLNPTHHTQGLNPLVVTIVAGADNKMTARTVLNQIASALPGFDLDVTPKFPTRWSESVGFWVVGLVLLAVLVGLWFVSGLWLWKFFVPLVGLFGLVGLSRFRGWRLTGGFWLGLALANEGSWFGFPARWRGLRFRKPVREFTNRKGNVVSDFEGDYPFAVNTFCVGPSVVVGVVAPQAGVLSGERVSRVDEVPAVFLDRVGPYVGDSPKGKVYLSAASTLFGTAVVGNPGSGKSRLIHGLFAWMMAEKKYPSGLPGFPGAQNTLVAFESKGGGVPSYRAWADVVGEDLLVIDLNRHDSLAIDLLDVPGSFNERANFFVNAMIYAFGKDAIGDRSFKTLTTAIAGGLCVTPEVAGNLASSVLDSDGGPLYFANVILGSHGWKTAVELMSAVIAQANTYERAVVDVRSALERGAYSDVVERDKAERFVSQVVQYIEAATGLKDLQERSESQFRSYVEAPVNKLFQLLESAGRSWFSRSRVKVSWQEILVSHRTVVINTGASELGDAVPTRLSEQLSSMLLFSLKEAISRHCVEWNAQGRSVSVFSDELALLAGHSSDVLRWVRDQGRSFGVRPFFATQRPEQLPADVRSVFLNFVNLVSFVQDERHTADEIAGAIETDGDWTRDMVQHLPRFTAAIRGQFDQQRQHTFSARVADFEGPGGSLMPMFLESQGYGVDSGVDSGVNSGVTVFEGVPVVPPLVFDDIDDDEGYPDLSVL